MFRFKQFTVEQDKTAMKVCTDSCLFGAWSAQKIIQQKINTFKVLDIGTGTGLLSLMLAQNIFASANIDAVEIDAAAFSQAKENFHNSPWKNQLFAIHSRLQDFKPSTAYDFIISNPPFYAENLHSPDKARNAAMHDTDLSLEELLQCIDRFLSRTGFSSILIPAFRTEELESLAKQNNLYVSHKIQVKQTESHPFFRTMFLLSRDSKTVTQETITIHDTQRSYTPAFIELLKDYYLYL